MHRARVPPVAASIAITAALLAACSSDGSDSAATRSEKQSPITVLVTNDDGYASAGIDAVVTELRALPGVTVTVVAPATNQSGSGSKTTDGALAASDGHTAGGYPAVAVEGFPADSVNYALDGVLERKPDLVVSGVNEGANLGPLTTISGTVGAAKRAAARGVPALAASQGLGEPPAYASAAKIVAGWVSAHRNELADGDAPIVALNLNVPTCGAGTLRGVEQVPEATDLAGATLGPVDCATTTDDPETDVAAFTSGFASVTSLQPDGEPTTSTTVWTSR